MYVNINGMKKRKVTDEQLRTLDRLIKEGKSNDEMYPLVGIKFSSLLMWKKRIQEEGLDSLLSKYSNERNITIQVMDELDIGGAIFVADGSDLNPHSLVTSMYQKGKRFSKIREAIGFRLVRRS